MTYISSKSTNKKTQIVTKNTSTSWTTKSMNQTITITLKPMIIRSWPTDKNKLAMVEFKSWLHQTKDMISMEKSPKIMKYLLGTRSQSLENFFIASAPKEV